MGAIFDSLPGDLRELVVQHWAASVLQCQFARWHRYRHVRRLAWNRLRARLPRTIHALLLQYASVRREWYYEPESWLSHTECDLRIVVAEAQSGWWGVPLAVR